MIGTKKTVESEPKVTIIVPVYNGANFLCQAIDSALNQTYPNIEILVINDGSTDQGATEAIARSYGQKIRYLCKENGGVASVLNFALREMSGEYFSWLSHDDIFVSEKIEKQVRSILNSEKMIISYTTFEWIDEHSNRLGKPTIDCVPPSEFLEKLLSSSFLHGCSLLIPKKAFDKVGRFREELRTTQDYDMWFRLSELYDFVGIPEVLLQSRIHSQQTGRLLPKTANKECNQLYIRMANALFPHQETTSVYFSKLAITFTRQGFIPASKHSAKLAFKKIQKNGTRKAFHTAVLLGLRPAIGCYCFWKRSTKQILKAVGITKRVTAIP